eukprot:752315-Hanusia_phi.AAC.1
MSWISVSPRVYSRTSKEAWRSPSMMTPPPTAPTSASGVAVARCVTSPSLKQLQVVGGEVSDSRHRVCSEWESMGGK